MTAFVDIIILLNKNAVASHTFKFDTYFMLFLIIYIDKKILIVNASTTIVNEFVPS